MQTTYQGMLPFGNLWLQGWLFSREGIVLQEKGRAAIPLILFCMYPTIGRKRQSFPGSREPCSTNIQSLFWKPTPMLHVQDLTVHFGSFVALARISFRLKPGEIFGFLGPNGAGKTTTLNVLTGQVRPTEGTVLLDGLSLWESFEDLKCRFGYVPDFDNHLEELSAYQNLALFCRLYGISKTRAREVLETVELDGERDQKVKNFSKGMKKKLTIAREILHLPELIYLDEPTANLDVHSTAVIRNLLKRLAGRGTTIFCTTHNMEEAEELCDRIAILDQGKAVGIDTPEGFKMRYAEPLVRVVIEGPEGRQTHWIRLDAAADKAFLAESIRLGQIISMHTDSASLKDVFLKLTGRAFS
jgi:ABC-2 type transport system ATP-binding protein